MPYIFVTASIISILVIIIAFKINIEKLKADPESSGHVQVRFFLTVALGELIPIILIIYGFINIETVTGIEELYLPGLIIILAIVIAAFFIFLQKAVGVKDKQTQQLAHMFTMITLSLIMSIPIVSIVALFTMLP